jgi:hypothetical protein
VIFHHWSLITFNTLGGNTVGIGFTTIKIVVVSQNPTLVADQETSSQVGVRIIRTGHIKGRGELMSMKIGEMVKVVMIKRVDLGGYLEHHLHL